MPGTQGGTQLVGPILPLVQRPPGVCVGIGGGIGVGSLGLTPANPGSARLRSATESVLVLKLMNTMRLLLEEANIYKSFAEVEMPVSMVIARMEMNGMGERQLLAVSVDASIKLGVLPSLCSDFPRKQNTWIILRRNNIDVIASSLCRMPGCTRSTWPIGSPTVQT